MKRNREMQGTTSKINFVDVGVSCGTTGKSFVQ